MKSLVSLGILLCVASCNSILGIQDLGESGGDGGGGDGGGGDGAGAIGTVRFLLVTPDIYEIDTGPATPAVAIYVVGGGKLLDATYGVVTPFVDLPASLTAVEIRSPNGATLHATVAVTFDRRPVAGEHATAVILGTLGADVSALDAARVVAFNDAEFGAGPEPQVRVVHAIADRTGPLSYAVTYAGVEDAVREIGSFSVATASEQLPGGIDTRVGFGQDVVNTRLSREVSFTLPAQAAGANVLLVLGGRQHEAVAGDDPGLTLHVVPVIGASTRVRQDPAFLLTNFLVDWPGNPLEVKDANDGTLLSVVSLARSTPMIVFQSPFAARTVIVEGVDNLAAFILPGVPAGTRRYIALTGYMSPVAAQPAAGAMTVEVVEGNDGLTHWAFIQASPDPAVVDLGVHNAANESDLTIAAGLAFRTSLLVSSAPDEIDLMRISPAGGSPIATFAAGVSGRRQITVLSGVQTGGESLRVTTTSLDRWPWTIGNAIVGQ